MICIRTLIAGAALGSALLAPAHAVAAPSPAVAGQYLEVRSCDVYTGYCVANGEMNLSGKEAILLWSIKQGQWGDVPLGGLSVMAVIHSDCTLGDRRYTPACGDAVIVVDSRATGLQRAALVSLVRSAAGSLVTRIHAVRSARIQAELGTCRQSGCARVKADELVEISTRCLGGKDHLCGNEETFYPPLTPVKDARPAFAEVAAYRGDDLDVTWQLTGKRSVYLATFAF